MGIGIIFRSMKTPLHAARKRARLTQKELEARSGVSQGSISRMERGEYKDATYATVVKLAKALRVKPETLGFGLSHGEAAR